MSDFYNKQDQSLRHFGVLGMKRGHRRAKNNYSNSQITKKVRETTNDFIKDGRKNIPLKMIKFVELRRSLNKDIGSKRLYKYIKQENKKLTQKDIDIVTKGKNKDIYKKTLAYKSNPKNTKIEDILNASNFLRGFHKKDKAIALSHKDSYKMYNRAAKELKNKIKTAKKKGKNTEELKQKYNIIKTCKNMELIKYRSSNYQWNRALYGTAALIGGVGILNEYLSRKH